MNIKILRLQDLDPIIKFEKDLLNNDISVNTALPDDPTIGGQGGVVQP